MQNILKTLLIIILSLNVTQAIADRNSEHAKIVAQFGGEVQDSKLTNYVRQVGDRMAKVSDMPTLDYRFTVLDSPVVNAFALPSGDLYVTRGLLSLANSEAELVGVIGHEIAHVTESHSSGRSTRAVGIGILSIIAGIAFESKAAADLVNIAGQGYVASYSRDQEYDADKHGVMLSRRAGYSPYGQANFLQSLAREAELAKRQAGVSSREDPMGGFFASHPNTADRVAQARERARGASTKKSWAGNLPTREGRQTYLDIINGMTFGDSAAQGFVRGRTFSHGELRLTFTVPEGFRIQNQPSAVVAVDQGGNQIKFTMATKPRYSNPTDHIRNEWGKDLKLLKLGETTVNKMQTGVGVARVKSKNGTALLRLVVVRGDQGQLYRFLFVDPQENHNQYMTSTVQSFRRLGKKEASALKPKRIRVIKTSKVQSHEHYAKLMKVEKSPLALFRVLNALQPGQEIPRGRLLKIVTY